MVGNPERGGGGGIFISGRGKKGAMAGRSDAVDFRRRDGEGMGLERAQTVSKLIMTLSRYFLGTFGSTKSRSFGTTKRARNPPTMRKPMAAPTGMATLAGEGSLRV